MISWVHNHLLLPLCEPDQHLGLGRRLRELERFDARPRQEQLAIQEKRIRAILDHAYETSPYYRLIFDEMGFRAVDWQPGQPIPLPELTRERLCTNLEDIGSRSFTPEKMLRMMTRGTTASPMAIWRDVEGMRNKTAMQIHLNRVSGYEQGMRVLRLWGAERVQEHPSSWHRRFYEETLLGRVNCGAGQLNDTTCGSFLDALNRQESEVLYGYPSTLVAFAKWLQGSGKRWHKPRLVIVTGEMMTDEQRRIVEETFACEAIVHYGSRDMGMVAAECEGGRLHFHPWASYVELLPAGQSPAGPLYRLVLTDLLNYGMPLIRYDTGDCVLYDESPCSCGSWYPSVTEVLGRTVDHLILPNGTLMAGLPIVMRAGRTFRTIRQVQLIQKKVDTMHLLFSSAGDGASAERELAEFFSDVEDAFRIPLQWTTERVPEIPRGRSGKLRLAICEVPTDPYATAWHPRSEHTAAASSAAPN
jgi:phenylacetate-CoA ligase